MRRTLVTFALLLVGAMLVGCGKSSIDASRAGAAASASSTSASPSTIQPPESTPRQSPSRRQAEAFARAVNLTAADVPGFAATAKREKSSSSEKRLERQMLSCAGISGSGKAVLEEGSKEFRLKHRIIDFGVSSEVAVQASAALAQKGLAAISSPHVRGCFSRYLKQIFKGEQTSGATSGSVTIQSGTPPAPGMSGSFGWRVTATFMVRGIKIPIYLDFLGFVDGPSEVTLLSSGLISPFPAAVQQHLFALLLSRARSHKP